MISRSSQSALSDLRSSNIIITPAFYTRPSSIRAIGVATGGQSGSLPSPSLRSGILWDRYRSEEISGSEKMGVGFPLSDRYLKLKFRVLSLIQCTSCRIVYLYSKVHRTILVYNVCYLQIRGVSRLTQVSLQAYDWEQSDLRCLICLSNDRHEHIFIPKYNWWLIRLVLTGKVGSGSQVLCITTDWKAIRC